MNKALLRAAISLVMSPIIVLLRCESNTLRSIFYGSFSFVAILCFYALLIIISGVSALSSYKAFVVLIGMLPTVIIIGYVTYLFSGISRSLSETRSFVEKVMNDKSDERTLDDVHQTTVVVMVTLATVVFLLVLIYNMLYIFAVAIGFRIMVYDQIIGSVIVLSTAVFSLLLANSKALRGVYSNIMKPLANKLHHA